MAPSPMSYAKLRVELLAAREAREALLAAVLREATAALVLISSAIPGPDKTPPGSAALFAWGLQELQQRLGNCRIMAEGDDVLGPYCIIAAAGDIHALKTTALDIETALPAACLLDLDVYSADGMRIGRAELGAPARRCLLCAEPAVDCIRLNRHPMERLLEHVGQLLSSFSTDRIDPLTSPRADQVPSCRSATGTGS